MPELPEVQTTASYLNKHVAGLKITGFWTDPKKPIKTGSGLAWKKSAGVLTGKKIIEVTRRAKYVLFHLSGGIDIYVHQKMSGHLLYGKWLYRGSQWISGQAGPLADKHHQGYIRMVFKLSNGRHVALCDQRRFGTMIVVRDGQIHRHKELARLGPEPLELALKDFKKLFFGRRGALKPVLMNPAFIAGVGNIYADEILWLSGLHPLTPVQRLDGPAIAALWRNTRGILTRAIRYGGSSIDDYRTASGDSGSFQLKHRAYQRTGLACAKKDGGIIERIVIGQRSCHFCPAHQVLK